MINRGTLISYGSDRNLSLFSDGLPFREHSRSTRKQQAQVDPVKLVTVKVCPPSAFLTSTRDFLLTYFR